MRLWVKRGFNGTPASILLDNEDLVDDVKDAVFRKYPVALARNFDSPDVSVCLITPSTTKASKVEAKILAVDERIGDLIRSNYPSGQRIEDALVIQVPNATQGRRSPYVGPRSSNSPLAGTIGLMTQEQDFEYFPHTPPVPGEMTLNNGSTQEYINNGRSYAAPATYSSGHSSASFNTQQASPNNVIEGAFRQAPVLTMNGTRYVRDRNMRPVMGPRIGTNTSSNNTSGVYGRNENGITFYPKQARTQRTHSATSQAQQARDETSVGNTHVPPPINLGDERSMSPSVFPLSEQELSASAPPSRQISVSVDALASLPETADTTLKPSSPQTARTRRETSNPHAAHPQRPGLTRALTASKLNLVSPAVSAHSSSNSVHKLEASVALKKPDVLPVQQPTFGVGGLLEGVVPPIVVLIVEDNMINQRILETFMKKRKIRCLTAKNGREAVDKWKKGGIHLVLMDIQMPVMSGIEATKEIRRLERTNYIGVFSKSEMLDTKIEETDVLTNIHFKSPVIIVALTASSLQSDRHEALAAGCNDFLTKPVSLVWLEKKVLEWGCMQALIDFEGWREFRGLKDAVKK